MYGDPELRSWAGQYIGLVASPAALAAASSRRSHISLAACAFLHLAAAATPVQPCSPPSWAEFEGVQVFFAALRVWSQPVLCVCSGSCLHAVSLGTRTLLCQQALSPGCSPGSTACQRTGGACPRFTDASRQILRFRATSESSACSRLGNYAPVISGGAGTISWGDAHRAQLPVCCGSPRARPGARH